MHFTSFDLTVTLSDKKKVMNVSSAAARDMISAADKHIGIEVDKQSEGDYEEIDNILNTPFAMEYNMSYSMVSQTAL